MLLVTVVTVSVGEPEDLIPLQIGGPEDPVPVPVGFTRGSIGYCTCWEDQRIW